MDIIKKVFGIDLRTLALFRVGFGFGILVDIMWRLEGFYAFYTDEGIVPRTKILSGEYVYGFSIHLMSGQPWVMGLLFFIQAVFAVMLLVGYRTRIAMVVSWFFLLSIQVRNPYVLQLGDNLLVSLAFWAMFLPLGARFSVDAALNKEPIPTNDYFSIATFAILWQAMYVYFIGALLKTGPEWLPQGTAVYYAMHWESYATTLGVWFRQFGWLLNKITYFVYFLELLAPVLMFMPFYFIPFRLTGVFLIVCMHIGFALFLNIGTFPYVSILSIVNFIPGWFWDRMGGVVRTRERVGVALYYDGECNFCLKVCLIFRTFFLLPETPILIAQDNKDIYEVMQQKNSWVVKDYDGKIYTRWEAVVLVLKRSYFFSGIAKLFKLQFMKEWGEDMYERIATNRAYLGGLASRWLPYRPISLKLPKLLTVFVFIATIFVMYWNISAVKGRFMYQLDPIARIFNMHHWTMFAPRPPGMANWYIVEGRLADGSVVDVYNREDKPPSMERPKYIFRQYEDYRWRKFMQELRWEQYNLRPDLGRYLCNRWNQKYSWKPLVSLEVYVNEEFTLPDYQGWRSNKRRAFGYNCQSRIVN